MPGSGVKLCAQRKPPPCPHGLPGGWDPAGGLAVGRCPTESGKKGNRWPRPLLALRGAPPQPTLSLPPQGKYSLQGPRVALTLSTPEVSASTVAVLEAVFRTLGFECCQRTEASVQVGPHLSPTHPPSARTHLEPHPQASLDSALAFALALGLPRGAGWVPVAAGRPRGPCGLCSSGSAGPPWAAGAAPAAGPGAEPL